MAVLKKIILSLGALVLMIAFTPLFGSIQKRYFGPFDQLFIGPAHPEYFEGFFMSYALFLTLFLVLFGGRKKYQFLAIGLGLLAVLNIISNTWTSLLTNFFVAIIALILAQVILWFYHQIAGKRAP